MADRPRCVGAHLLEGRFSEMRGIKLGEEAEQWNWQRVIEVVREGLSEEVTFELTLQWQERAMHAEN